MSSVTATLPTFTISGRRRPKGVAEARCGGTVQLAKFLPSLSCSKSKPFQSRMPVLRATRAQARSVICAAPLNARCGAFQTQTITRQSSTFTSAPMRGKNISPELDYGGVGLPPRDDGGSGGGGGWGGWSGGFFFFFGFLALLAFFREKETEDDKRTERRRQIS